MTAKDFLGFDLRAGDDVVFAEPVLTSLIRGVVTEVNERGVLVRYESGQILKDPKDLIKQVISPDQLRLIKFTIGSEQ